MPAKSRGVVVADEFADAVSKLVAESESLDFKRVGNVESVVKTVSAMANTSGGIVILGLEDAGKASGRDRLFGLEEKPECEGEIRRAMHSRVTPSLAPPACEMTLSRVPCKLREGTMGHIGIISVSKSNAVHSIVNGGTYGRFGSQNRQLSALEITELSLRRGVTSAVDIAVDVPVELLQTDTWQEYYKERGLSRDFPDCLRHLGLAEKEFQSGRWQPTVAAVLLFAEHPGDLLKRKCSIRVFHYRGHEVEYDPNTNLARPPITIDGPVLKQIRDAIKTVQNELSSGIQVSTQGVEFRQRYPVRVIQEAITNAVIHRDYRLSRDIHLRIFTNRIEVESPGVLPGAVTPENIGEIGSKPRNRALGVHLREFDKPPNLDAGEGVRMMFATMKRDGLYPPFYEEEADPLKEYVRVTLRNEARLSEWELFQDYLREHKTAGNADVRRILNLAGNRVKASKLLREWVDKGLIEIANPDAGTRNRKYRLRSAAEPKPLEAWLGRRLLSKGYGKELDELFKILLEKE